MNGSPIVEKRGGEQAPEPSAEPESTSSWAAGSSNPFVSGRAGGSLAIRATRSATPNARALSLFTSVSLTSRVRGAAASRNHAKRGAILERRSRSEVPGHFSKSLSTAQRHAHERCGRRAHRPKPMRGERCRTRTLPGAADAVHCGGRCSDGRHPRAVADRGGTGGLVSPAPRRDSGPGATGRRHGAPQDPHRAHFV